MRVVSAHDVPVVEPPQQRGAARMAEGAPASVLLARCPCSAANPAGAAALGARAPPAGQHTHQKLTVMTSRKTLDRQWCEGLQEL